MITDLGATIRLARLPVWRELGAVAEAAAVLRTAAPAPVARPGAAPVVFVPGVLAPDATTALLRGWLETGGWTAAGSGLGWNTACASVAVRVLEDRVGELVREHGTKAVLVGHSRGGQHARVLAVRRPDLVRTVITLGTPQRRIWAMHPALRTAQLTGAVFGSTFGGASVLRISCMQADGCCAAYTTDLGAAPPPGLDIVAVHTREDAVVNWRDCLDPHAEQIRVTGTHSGLIANPQVLGVLHHVLAGTRPQPG
jgi:triacylglycerol lipase